MHTAFEPEGITSYLFNLLKHNPRLGVLAQRAEIIP